MVDYTDPTSRPVDPAVKQSPPRLGEAVPTTGTFADSEAEYPRTSESEGGSTVDTAKSEAGNIKDTASGAASDVKDVTKGEVSNVAGEAKYQARNLVDQTRSELRGQVGNQQAQLASRLNGWASELGSMASKSDDSGPMTDLAHEASRRVGEFSHWLDNHEPADLLYEVKRFARRQPVAFLALAAAAGVVAGRLTRGAVAANTSVDSDKGDVTPARAYDSDAYDRGGNESGLVDGGGYGARGYDPRYGEVAGETSYQGGGIPAPGQYAGGTAAPGEYPTSDPASTNVTPATDEPYYPPPTEGEVRR